MLVRRWAVLQCGARPAVAAGSRALLAVPDRQVVEGDRLGADVGGAAHHREEQLPGRRTSVSVAVAFQVVGSAVPSAQILNWIVEPTDPQPQPLLRGRHRLATGHRLQVGGDAVDVLLHRDRGRVGLQLQAVAVLGPVGVLPAARTPQVDAEVARARCWRTRCRRSAARCPPAPPGRSAAPWRTRRTRRSPRSSRPRTGCRPCRCRRRSSRPATTPRRRRRRSASVKIGATSLSVVTDTGSLAGPTLPAASTAWTV